VTTSTRPKKGILKRDKVAKKIRLKWEPESKLEKVKIFKSGDEPDAQPVTDEEYYKIQNEILKNPNYKYHEDMRTREVNMEKENMSKARDKGKMNKVQLTKMLPQMQWRRPMELKAFQDNLENENIKGTESTEKLIINSLIGKILGVTYFRVKIILF
jgi:hypothetical protein